MDAPAPGDQPPFDDPMRWVRPENAVWASRVHGVGEFLERLPAMLSDAAQALGAVTMSPVLGGWGGAVARAGTVHGTVAVKLPHLAATARREWDGARLLWTAGAGPRPVAAGDGWYATEWVDADAVGPLLVRRSLHADRAGELLGRLGTVDAHGLADATSHLAGRCDVEGRAHLLAQVGLHPARVLERTDSLRLELATAGRWGLCHGDLHPANVLDDGRHWWALDCTPYQGPRESDAGWLAVTAACGEPDRETLAEVCFVAGLDPELVQGWALAFAAECLTCLLAEFPDRRDEIAGLATFAAHL